jgi:hypothetical protein
VLRAKESRKQLVLIFVFIRFHPTSNRTSKILLKEIIANPPDTIRIALEQAKNPHRMVINHHAYKQSDRRWMLKDGSTPRSAAWDYPYRTWTGQETPSHKSTKQKFV